MAINFPTSPSTNDTFTVGSITYKWDGAKWIGLGVTPTDRLIEGSNSLEINASNELVWTGGDAKFGGSLEVGANIDLTDSTVDLYSQTTNAASKTFQLFSDIGGTKTEKVFLTADGAGYFKGSVGINETNPDRQLSVYDGTNSGVEIKSGNTGQSSVFFTDTDDGNIGMIGYTHNNDEMFLRVNDQTRLNITSSGYVTKPYQPAFIVRYSVNETTWNVATDGWQKILFDEEMMDKGGNYSTASSEFTAPVTGAYLFGAELQLEAPNGITSGYLTSGSNWMYITFVVNGSTTLVESKGGVRADANFNAMYNAYNPTHLLNLAAGDTVCMYRTGNYSSIKFKGGGESVFWGYLVA